MVLLLYRRLFVVINVTVICFVARQVYSTKPSTPKHRNVLFLLGTKKRPLFKYKLFRFIRLLTKIFHFQLNSFQIK